MQILSRKLVPATKPMRMMAAGAMPRLDCIRDVATTASAAVKLHFLGLSNFYFVFLGLNMLLLAGFKGFKDFNCFSLDNNPMTKPGQQPDDKNPSDNGTPTKELSTYPPVRLGPEP
ncbi:hypothetical protein DFH06DRAFT_1484677 [Mycena polygramma]|nr:hypothetical protein DFH06DRAFT_1484677 [Mycena polygramma]